MAAIRPCIALLYGLLLCQCKPIFAAQDSPSVDEPRFIAAVANLDQEQVSFFDAFAARAIATIPVANAEQLIGSAICPLSDGSVRIALSDFNGSVHLFDFQTLSLLQSISITEPAAGLSCCGDFLLVSSGSFSRRHDPPPPAGINDRPPVVVDLIQAIQVAQDALDLPGVTVLQCDALGHNVLAASQAQQSLYRFDFDPQRGQLSENFEQLDITDPLSIALSPGGRCGALVQNDDQLLSLQIQPLQVVDQITMPGSLSPLDACMGPQDLFVRSAFPDRLNAFAYDLDCSLAATPRWQLELAPPASLAFANVASLACSDQLVFASVDGGDATPDGDAVAVIQQADGRVNTLIAGLEVDGPQGLAIYFQRPPLAVPLLGMTGFVSLIGLLLLTAGRTGRQA